MGFAQCPFHGPDKDHTAQISQRVEAPPGTPGALIVYDPVNQALMSFVVVELNLPRVIRVVGGAGECGANIGGGEAGSFRVAAQDTNHLRAGGRLAGVYGGPSVLIILLAAGWRVRPHGTSATRDPALFRIGVAENLDHALCVQGDALHNRMIGKENLHVLIRATLTWFVVLDVVAAGAGIQVKAVMGSAGNVTDARMLSHNYRNVVGIGRPDVSRTTGAGVYHQYGREIRIGRQKIKVWSTGQGSKRVNLGRIQFGFEQVPARVAVVLQNRFHRHIT